MKMSGGMKTGWLKSRFQLAKCRGGSEPLREAGFDGGTAAGKGWYMQGRVCTALTLTGAGWGVTLWVDGRWTTRAKKTRSTGARFRMIGSIWLSLFRTKDVISAHGDSVECR